MAMQCAEYWVFELQGLLSGLLGTTSAAAQGPLVYFSLLQFTPALSMCV